jgi:uncharacterized protein
LLTLQLVERLRAARAAGQATLECSLDLSRSISEVELHADDWRWQGSSYPYPERCKERTVYYWGGAGFEPAARFTTSLVKLVPTEWGPPTFEIDGIKMLPTARVSPYLDAAHKVRLVQPRGKRVLDTCGGLGYFAACCLDEHAAEVLSYEKNADVLWLRSLNPWSPAPAVNLRLASEDITSAIKAIPAESVEAVLHDPPRFGIAGELYSRDFYGELARVLRRRGRLFHYTGTPNKLTSGRDVPLEVTKRLRDAGFNTELHGDGIVATRI